MKNAASGKSNLESFIFYMMNQMTSWPCTQKEIQPHYEGAPMRSF